MLYLNNVHSNSHSHSFFGIVIHRFDSVPFDFMCVSVREFFFNLLSIHVMEIDLWDQSSMRWKRLCTFCTNQTAICNQRRLLFHIRIVLVMVVQHIDRVTHSDIIFSIFPLWLFFSIIQLIAVRVALTTNFMHFQFIIYRLGVFATYFPSKENIELEYSSGEKWTSHKIYYFFCTEKW